MSEQLPDYYIGHDEDSVACHAGNEFEGSIRYTPHAKLKEAEDKSRAYEAEIERLKSAVLHEQGNYVEARATYVLERDKKQQLKEKLSVVFDDLKYLRQLADSAESFNVADKAIKQLEGL